MNSLVSRACLAGLIVAMVASACGGSVPASTPDAMEKPAGTSMPKPTEETVSKPDDASMPKPTEDAMAKPTESASGDAMASMGPAWLNIGLTDVNTGQAFKLSDFQGQVVLVEAMAVWCTNCLRQQRELQNLHAQIGDAAISVAIDVDLNEDENLLAEHAGRNGFDWRYAVASPELAQAFADEFGNRFLNPPGVPMFLIDRGGGVHLLDFGHKTVDYLIAQIRSYP